MQIPELYRKYVDRSSLASDLSWLSWYCQCHWRRSNQQKMSWGGTTRAVLV